MEFALLFPLLAAAFCMIASEHGGWTWWLVWPALSFLLVGIAYGMRSARLFGKRADGTMAWRAVTLLLPYLLFTWGVWHIVRWVHRVRSREPFASQVAPGLWLSRRVLAREVPAGVTCVVDMTCEFPAAPGLTKAVPHCLCVPTLDYSAPSVEQVLELVAKLRAMDGSILIHCAQGHGRSAMIAAALMLATGVAGSAEEALQLIKQVRPNVRLSRNQRRMLEAVAKRVQPPQVSMSTGLKTD